MMNREERDAMAVAGVVTAIGLAISVVVLYILKLL